MHVGDQEKDMSAHCTAGTAGKYRVRDGKAVFSYQQAILFRSGRASTICRLPFLTITSLHITSLCQNVLDVFFYAIVPGNDFFLQGIVQCSLKVKKTWFPEFPFVGTGPGKKQQKALF